VTYARFLFPLMVLFGFPSAADTGQTAQGSAQVIDGDSLQVAGTEIHLFGIDAPEVTQQCEKAAVSWSCGAEARDVLAQLVDGQHVECRVQRVHTDGKAMALCKIEELDLGLAMIEAGLAVTTDASPATYVQARTLRQTHKIGLWPSNFQAHADWRTEHMPKIAIPAERLARANAYSAPEQVYRNKFGCAIKGNRNRKGQWIYHLPGKPHYDKTRPEELFCTESDARNAGYRRSKA
jgi:endonuclease YncB( thermonuclease family)